MTQEDKQDIVDGVINSRIIQDISLGVRENAKAILENKKAIEKYGLMISENKYYIDVLGRYMNQVILSVGELVIDVKDIKKRVTIIENTSNQRENMLDQYIDDIRQIKTILKISS
jgi:hypothetical protein